MLLLDTWRLWKALYRDGGLLITTVDAQGVGLRTLLQADGDMIIGVSTALTDQEDLVQRHAAEVAQALSALPRLRRALRRYGTLHVSVGWHMGGSVVGYTMQSLGPYAGGPYATRLWFSEGSVLLALVLAAGWGLQQVLPRWLGPTHDRWVALLISAGPLLMCGAVWGYQRWSCGRAPCPAQEMMVSMMLPLLVAGGFGMLRLLCKYGVRRYIQRALDLA